MAPPTTRTVVRYAQHGSSSVLEVVGDAPLPLRKKGQVLVENHATSVNPVDYKMRDGLGGLVGKLAAPRLPCVPGGDVAGVVVAADEGSQFKPGDRVAALTWRCVGAYASHVVVPEAALARIPDGMSFEDAAAVPLAGLTAWQALELGRVKEGDRVLVHAGAGGVGTFAIQLAKARGAFVATTCSAKNTEFVRGLGADEVVDYNTQRFEEVFRGHDAAFDCVIDMVVTGGYEQRSLQVVKKKTGTFVHVLVGPEVGQILTGLLRGALGLGPRYRVEFVTPNGAQLERVFAVWQEGRMKPQLAAIIPLAQAAEAQDQTKLGHNRGKIVLTIP